MTNTTTPHAGEQALTPTEAIRRMEHPLGETRDLIMGAMLAVRIGTRDGLTEEDCQGVVAILVAAQRECSDLERRWDQACATVGIGAEAGEA